MAALLDAITVFAAEFNQDACNFGKLKLLPRLRTVPVEMLPVSQLQTFYASVELEELIIGRSFFLDIAPLDKLARYQEGWGWVYDAEHPTGRPDTEYWQRDWLVFGDRNGDAIFTKLHDEHSPVFASVQKAREYQLATSLGSFLTTLAACLAMERAEFAYETKHEDYTLKPAFLARTREIVTRAEEPRIADDFVNFFFG